MDEANKILPDADAHTDALARARDVLAGLDGQIRSLTAYVTATETRPAGRAAVDVVDAYEAELAALHLRARAIEDAHAAAIARAEAAEAERNAARLSLAAATESERIARREATALKVELDRGTTPAGAARAELAMVLRYLYQTARALRIRPEGLPQEDPSARLDQLLALDPIVDERFYVAAYGDRLRPGESGADHFRREGAREGLVPNAFVDLAWYANTYGLDGYTPVELLLNFMDSGVPAGRDPGPAFSTNAYFLRHHDIAHAGTNPLSHYIHSGAAEGRAKASSGAGALEVDADTSYRAALVAAGFDADWYRRCYPDILESGYDPLFHYLECGAAEGRDAGPGFSTEAYLADHPDVAARGENPLVHFAFTGRFEGRAARAAVAAPIATVTAAPPSPMLHPRAQTPRFALREIAPRQPGGAANPKGPLLVCVTHVPPFPMRAGNEYRTGRFLDWLQAKGFRTAVMVGPLDSPVSDDQLDAIGARYGDVAVVDRGGEIRLQSRSGRLRLKDIAGREIRAVGKLVLEPEVSHEGTILQHERTFCFDALADAVLFVQQLEPRITFYLNYIFMTRWLPLMDRGHRAFIDMHDLFSSKLEQVHYFGVADSLAFSAETEARLMRRADAIFAIQAREAEIVRGMAPGVAVVTAGVDFDFVEMGPAPEGARILVVGSDNHLNRKGIADFLRFAWDRIRSAHPDAELRIVGGIGAEVPRGLPGVRPLGFVEDLATEYRAARLVVNPVVAGTGLKVKSVEALSHLRPLVAWPNGVDGIEPDLLGNSTVARSWLEFADASIAVLTRAPHAIDATTRARLVKRFGGDAVYAEAGRWLGVERTRAGGFAVARQPGGWWRPPAQATSA